MREPHPPRPNSRYPDYDVLEKRDTPSWNEKTREVIARRLAIGSERPEFFNADEFLTVDAIAARIVPQPDGRPPIPVAGLVDEKLHIERADGFRRAGMPREGEAWRITLHALDVEAEAAYGKPFRSLDDAAQDAMLRRMEKDELKSEAWQGLPCADLFKNRIGRDIVYAYYAHPSAWSEIGWGGPASPRGYVRMDFNERDPWEAIEVKGDSATAPRKERRDG
ncbi:MAG: gluconate 2-dehydrogenase subunit 3 family protein [Rhizobiaceae bacterium]